MKNSKTFRLFVSSTFSDFAKERAVLQKKVFPEIKKYCAGKGYTFQPIDLRWGVNNEAQLDQKTIELCLNEVRICKNHPHPNFLIMAGDRYGWVPLPYMIGKDEFDMLLKLMNEDEKKETLFWYQLDLNQLPASYILKRRDGKYEQWQEWSEVESSLRKILQAKAMQTFQNGSITETHKRKYFMSATEAEVEEGIFNYLEPTEFQKELSQKLQDLPKMDKDNIFGFFRNIQKETAVGNAFIRNDYDRAQAFKENVKNVLVAENILEVSTIQKSEDALDESYLEELEERLSKFLKTKVDAHIENEKQYSEQESKQQAQEYFLREKTNNFIGRDKVLDSIANYISGKDTRSLVVYGTSGIGKSAIIAKAILQTRQRQGKKVVFRFVGATTDASSTQEVLIGIFDDLGIDTRSEKNNEIGEILQADKKTETFEDFSYRVHDQIMSLKDQVIIFIDAVDQFTNTDQFLWLPKTLPQNVKIIISALDDEKYQKDSTYFQTLKNKTDNLLLIPLFEQPEQLLTNILTEENRTVQEDQKQIFLAQQYAITSPLYIHIVAQDMKHWKSLEKEHTLAPAQQDAIRDFIAHLTDRHHHDRRFVQKIFGYITASENGLSEDEIIDLLSMDTAFTTEMAPETYHKNETGEFPLVIWARLYTQLKSFFGIKREYNKDLLYFFHREFETISNAQSYVRTEHEAIIAQTQKLIKTHQNEDFNSNRWGKLYATLIVHYDLMYEDEAKREMYAHFISDDVSDEGWVKKFVSEMHNMWNEYNAYNYTKQAITCGIINDAITEKLYYKESEYWIKDYIVSLNSLASSLRKVSKIQDAIILQEKSLAIAENIYDKDPEQWTELYITSLNNLSVYFKDVQKIDEAITLGEKSLAIAENIYNKDPEHWAKNYVTSLNNLAMFQNDDWKKYDAIVMQKKCLMIVEKLYNGDPEYWARDYIQSLRYLALYLRDADLKVTNNTNEAILLQKKCLAITEKLYNENPEYWAEDYTSIIYNLATSFELINERVNAVDFAKKLLAIWEELYNKNPERWAEGYVTIFADYMQYLIKINDVSNSIKLQEKLLAIAEKLYQENPEHWVKLYAQILNNFVIFLEKVSKTTEANALLEKKLVINERFCQEYQNNSRRNNPYVKSIDIFLNETWSVSERDSAEGAVLQRKYMIIIEKLHHKDPEYWAKYYIRSIKNFATSLVRTYRVTEAIALGEKCVSIAEKLYHEDPERWAKEYIYSLKALVVFFRNGKNKAIEIIALQEKCVSITEKLYHENPEHWAEEHMRNINDLIAAIREFKPRSGLERTIISDDELITLKKNCLIIKEKLYHEDPERWAKDYLDNLHYLAASLKEISQITEAIALEEKNLAIIKMLYHEDSKLWFDLYQTSLDRSAEFFEEIKMTTEAIILREEYWAIIEADLEQKYQKDYELGLNLMNGLHKAIFKERIIYFWFLSILYFKKGCQEIIENSMFDLFWTRKIKLFFKMFRFIYRRMNGDQYRGTVEEEFKKFKA